MAAGKAKKDKDARELEAAEPETVAEQATGLPAALTVEAGTGRPVLMTAAQGPITLDGQHAVIE